METWMKPYTIAAVATTDRALLNHSDRSYVMRRAHYFDRVTNCILATPPSFRASMTLMRF